MTDLPEFAKQGERARLVPILADTSREKRVASVFLSILQQIPALAEELIKSVGQRYGKRSRVECFTEVVLKSGEHLRDRPDGCIQVTNGRDVWSALLEVKIGRSALDADQVARYLEAARDNAIPAVITISNEFTAKADESPVNIPKSLQKKVALFHWSWSEIATHCEILTYQKSVTDIEQAFLLSELNRFLSHENTGVERFSQMGPLWKDLVQAVANGDKLKRSAAEVEEAVACWFSEERDLGLQLSRHVGRWVSTRMDRRIASDRAERTKQEISQLIETHTLNAVYQVPDGAADLEVVADLARKTIAVSMRLRAPADRKTSKGRVSWLMQMLKDDDARLVVRAHWPGRAPPTMALLAALRQDQTLLESPSNSAVPHSFEVILIEELGQRFGGRKSFIADLERLVPEFYDMAGQHLRAWQARPPKPVSPRLDESIDLPTPTFTEQVPPASPAD